MLPEVGELVFSFVIGYMGALEFLYVVRHLYHWGFRHHPEMRDYKSEAESLRKLQDQLKTAIAEAKEREAMGLKAMQDGVMYKDGFRIDEDQKKIEELKEKVRIQEQIAERQREIEEELKRQQKIEEETKQQLKKAEEELHRIEEEKRREKQKAEEEKRKAEEARKKAEDDKRKAEEEEIKRKQKLEEEENMRKILEEEKRKEEEQRRIEEEKENERKLLQAEKEREEKQRQLELEQAEKARIEEQLENERKLLEAERKREEKQRELEREEELRREREENELKLLQAEREREEQQRQQEIEDEKVVQKLLEAERERERAEQEQTAKLLEAERQQEIERQQRELDEEEERENIIKLMAAEKEAIEKQRELEENEENMRNLLKAERELELKKQEMEEEAENLQRLIEAEKQMEERQRQVDEEALQKLKTAQEEMELRQTFDPNAEAEEEAFIKKEIGQAEASIPQTVKTQYGQTSLKPKSLLFPGISEESSSAEPASSLQSSFSTQISSEAVQPSDLHFDEYERQAPDGGEDMPSLQYSDDYLRSLDGIKNKPLVREDGSGRRRAFKKRRSSGSSTSSRESRASREEELKMFTSLEEEEFENIRKGDSEYDAIKYASEPNLKVTKQHRRHKRSPAKDAKRDPSDKSSLEMLDEEESSNPWGEVKPESYKNTDFWKREKRLSIDEEQEEFDAKQRIQSPSTAAVNIPKMSSFEEATKSQHEEAISALKRQMSKDPEPIQEPTEDVDDDDNATKSDTKNVSKLDADGRLSPAGSNSSPASASASASITLDALQSPQTKRENSLETEARALSPSTGMRRSPRVDEMREYEEKWKTEDRKARAEAGNQNPEIEIEYASDEEPMSPEHLMEGISDFYDFNASINPRRSRSRSRSKTPALIRSVSLPERRTPSPLNSSHIPARSESRSPSPDPASYKFIVQRIIPNLESKTEPPPPPDHGLSDFYDFHTKLNQDALHGVTGQRSHEIHRTSVDYVLEDLRNEKPNELGATIAKTIDELKTSPTTPEYERSISAEMQDVQKLKEEMLSGSFKRSTYVGESMDFSDEFESLREEAKHFQRSRSCSRSPPVREDIEEMKARVLARQQLQDQILDDIVRSSQNSQEFSEDITIKTIDRNRRASDTALIQKPEILFQIQDLIQETDENFNIIDCEPEEYHHFRRFSLGQEAPVEQYPEDYSYVSEIEIRPLVDLKNLTGDIEVLEELDKEDSASREEVVEEAYESGSDDERQTVVEVDDEIDEDIWEYNEKPAEESHNEQSECEEADRELDQYANRNADDWREVEGAVGVVSDEDSFQIDQIYDEAIKNRKPSGILREFDCILKEIQISDEDRFEEESLLETDSYANGNNFKSLDPGMWSPRSRSSRGSSRDSSSRSFIEYERRDNEMRYLADPTASAINSTRLRSRYGIVPSTSLPTGFEDDTIDVDLNYKPKKEYNWRKNFKLDDDLDETKNNKDTNQYLDTRKFSLGGESITLFSQSPERPQEDKAIDEDEEPQDKILEEEANEEIEKPTKKKKNRRRSRKGSKGSIGETEESPQEDKTIDEELQEEILEEDANEEIEKPTKKKKNRRRSRKGSKGSIGETEERENLAEQLSSISEVDSGKKKHRRESKKTAEIVAEVAAGDETIGSKEKEEEPESSQGKKKSRKHRKSKGEIILPKLDIVIPTPEKKAPPPSVAALRAALSAPPPPPPPPPPPAERKPKKLWEPATTSTVSDKKTPTEDLKPKKLWEKPSIKSPLAETIPSDSSRSSNSPQPVTSEPPTSSVSHKIEQVPQENGSVSKEVPAALQEVKTSSSQTVAFTLETHSLTLTKDELTVKSEIKVIQTSETKNLDSTKSELPTPQSTPETSTQNPTVQNVNSPESLNEGTAQKSNTVKLDSDILIDGGLYPLF